jgi:hypothetical protein
MSAYLKFIPDVDNESITCMHGNAMRCCVGRTVCLWETPIFDTTITKTTLPMDTKLGIARVSTHTDLGFDLMTSIILTCHFSLASSSFSCFSKLHAQIGWSIRLQPLVAQITWCEVVPFVQ